MQVYLGFSATIDLIAMADIPFFLKKGNSSYDISLSIKCPSIPLCSYINAELRKKSQNWI